MGNSMALIVNILLYFGLGVYVLRASKKSARRIRLITIIAILYLVMSVFSLMLFENPMSFFEDLSISPFIYLFICLLICFYPLIKFDERRIINLKAPIKRVLDIVVLLSIIVAFINSFDTIKSLSGLSTVIVEVSSLNESYNDTRLSMDYDHGFNIIKTLGYLFSDLYILFLFYYLSLENKTRFEKNIVYALTLSLMLSIAGNLISGIRGPIVSTLFNLCFMYILFAPRLNILTKKAVKKIITIFFVFICSSFVVITIARFGKDSYNASVGMTASYSVEYYIGQQFLYFNNSVLNSGGTREADKTFPLLKQILGFEVSKNWADRRLRYAHMKINDSVFYTFVGDFVLDFGPEFAMLILVFISLINNYLINRVNKREINFFQIILLYVLFTICAQGFTLYPYSELGGNRTLVFMLIIGAILSITNKNHSNVKTS